MRHDGSVMCIFAVHANCIIDVCNALLRWYDPLSRGGEIRRRLAARGNGAACALFHLHLFIHHRSQFSVTLYNNFKRAHARAHAVNHTDSLECSPISNCRSNGRCPLSQLNYCRAGHVLREHFRQARQRRRRRDRCRGHREMLQLLRHQDSDS